MDPRDYLLRQFKRLNRIDYYYNIVKLVPVIIFIIVCPLMGYYKILGREYFDSFFLILAEVLFIFLGYSLFKIIRKTKSFNKSTLYKCLNEPDMVNKIIISNSKILFDIPGMEDEVVYLNNSDYKSEMVGYFKSLYGESRVITDC